MWKEGQEKQPLRNRLKEQAIIMERMQSKTGELGSKCGVSSKASPTESAATIKNRRSSLNPSKGAGSDMESTKCLKR